MMNKFSSIDNAYLRQLKYNELRREIYLIMSSEDVWRKWRSVFKKDKNWDLINPDTSQKFNADKKFKCMNPLVKEFLKNLQGLTEKEMEKAASHILHLEPTTKRCWFHPKIIFTKPEDILSIMLPHEGLGGEPEEEDNHHARVTQAGAGIS